jgi:2-polyprenyl-3-methyl-5-hydroxy-6-metoxy-1,4-benzoquinol methylase
MPSEFISTESISFDQRAQLTELMDQPSSYEEFRACLRDLEKVNRTVLAYRPTLRWLQQFESSTAETINILDVGFGAGDMLRRIEQWTRNTFLTVHLTGIDLNPHCIRAAREVAPPASRIKWFTADVFSYKPTAPVDIVLSSIFTHHLTDAEIVRFLQWMEHSAQRGWFINDLARSARSYKLFKLLARHMGWHRFVQHDGPVSILRSFTSDDWRGYIHEAGLDHLPIKVFSAWPGRLCVSRVKS